MFTYVTYVPYFAYLGYSTYLWFYFRFHISGYHLKLHF